MKTEKRIGYVSILNKEFRSSLDVTIHTGGGCFGVELHTTSLKVARIELKQAIEEICVGQKGHIYEVILRRVE